jgi:hypothetical protein
MFAHKPIEFQKKPEELETENFAKWLVKEFNMSKGGAKYLAFIYPPDAREVMMVSKEQMPKITLDEMRKLANAPPTQIYRNMRILKEKMGDLREFTEFDTLRFSEKRFREFHGIPEKEEMTVYSFSNKRQFYYLITRLSADEQKAFTKIRQVIEQEGSITREGIKEIFKQNVASHLEGYSQFTRLNKILRELAEDGALNKREESVEKQK